LYLSLLTTNPRGKVDPTADVVANFLRWIPAHDDIKRRLVLDAALFSKPFNQDDLTAFEYLKDDRSSLYQWLISQPFVLTNPDDGLHVYHDLTQNLFARYLFQRSRQEYFEARRTLAQHYQRQIEKISLTSDPLVTNIDELLKLVLASIQQLFYLPNEAGYTMAIEHLLKISKYLNEEQKHEITRVLHRLILERVNNQITIHARQIIVRFLDYINADQNSIEFVKSANYILDKVAHQASFPSSLLASIHYDLGKSYQSHKELQSAISHFESAIELDQENASAYNLRGTAYYTLNQYQRAIQDYATALEIDPRNFSAYHNRGRAYYKLSLYQNALLISA
jgi:tetratricopeptide (TPR) repeat protein